MEDANLFRDMKSFRLKDKLLVYGFIRAHEQETCTSIINTSDNTLNRSSYHIPPLIIEMCIWYIHEKEQWYNCGRDMQINADRDTVTTVLSSSSLSRQGRASAFGSMAINLTTTHDKIFQWNLEIITFDYNGTINNFMDIGICTDRAQQLDENFNDVPEPDLFYEYDNEGTITSQQSVGDRYGCKFHEGDMIGMQINAQRKTLSFSVNGEDQGPVDIADRTYYLAISFEREGTCVRIVDFSELAAN